MYGAKGSGVSCNGCGRCGFCCGLVAEYSLYTYCAAVTAAVAQSGRCYACLPPPQPRQPTQLSVTAEPAAVLFNSCCRCSYFFHLGFLHFRPPSGVAGLRGGDSASDTPSAASPITKASAAAELLHPRSRAIELRIYSCLLCSNGKCRWCSRSCRVLAGVAV